jgi:hypothetical protein
MGFKPFASYHLVIYPPAMRRIVRLTGLLLLLALPAHASHSPPKILFRVFVQTAGEGLPANEAREVVVPPNNETIMVRAMPELTEQNLVDVRADASGSVHFLLDHAGQVDLDAVTGQDQGRILVVSLNGYVIYAPIIDEQITNGELIVPHPLDPRILELLQQIAQQNVRQARKA